MGDGRRLGIVSAVLFLFAVLVPCVSADAQENMEEEAPPPNTGNVGIDAGIDVTTHYFFRGALQEDQGLIIQPWGELGINVFDDNPGPVHSVDVYAGIWTSFHEEQTGAMTDADGPDSWYEADLYVGTSIGLPANFSADLAYIAYTSPNDAWNTIEEIDLGLSFDDSELWADTGFALSPSATLAFEIDNTLLGTDEGVFLGLGIEPSFDLVDSADYPITLAVPVTVGLGLDNYYEDMTDDNETFGFASIKPTLSTPLSFMPRDYGEWTLSAAVEFLFLGDTNEALNNGDDFEAVGTLGLSLSY